MANPSSSDPLPQRKQTKDLEANMEPTFLSGSSQSPTSESSPAGWQPSGEKRVRITSWRAINTVFLLGVGIGKAVSAYGGGSTIPTTLDLIGGVAWALASSWASVLENEHPQIWPWMFQYEILTAAGLIALREVLLGLLILFMALVGFYQAGNSIVDKPGDGIKPYVFGAVFVPFFAAMMYLLWKTRNWILRMNRPRWLHWRLPRLSFSDWSLNNFQGEKLFHWLL
ncbi:hypothetical protein GALMADRAFT_272226 [Galerina marginata CBS 339.88]|uniref:Uncharacterized protein n=1 Tax=Galerina marginata (strain CBS 339.88) TaxID=685588 RepID=A0A067SQQ2_GALM3|nr:hypothetical protein GALMADRAFT_272226 [Galerina marginata CBS 339.88]